MPGGDEGLDDDIRTPTPTGLAGGALTAEDFAPAPRAALVQTLTRPSLSYWQDAWIRLKKNRQALVSLGITAFLLLFTLIGPWLWQIDPSDQNLSRISESPSWGRRAVVVPEADEFVEIVVPVAASATAKPGGPRGEENDADALTAPATLEFIGLPSTQSVRLKWSAVDGATGYAIYRTDRRPSSRVDIGIPIGETDAGGKVSYEDKFDLKPQGYFYSIVPKSGENEAELFKTVEANLPTSITLTEAQNLKIEGVALGAQINLPPHPLGTDYLGRDLLARLMTGARVSLFIGILAPLVWTLVGLIIGGLAGYFGGRVDDYLMRFTDFVLALPFVLFAILFRIAMGTTSGESGIFPMILAMIALLWTSPARLVRGEILKLRESEFVHAARLLGARPMYILARHLLPNTMGVILVSVTFSIPYAIFTEAFLSFIGMGVVPPTPSWGSMCNDGIKTFLTHPHEFLSPALFISLAVLAFNLLGDGLRDALDPRMRSVS